jgi:AcrR family transcriptional regulator
MPRKPLSQDQIDSFRDDLCRVATRLIAERGFDGVTLRALASELGCSPMTPYRYFADKEEIFQAARAAAFTRFGETQWDAVGQNADPLERLWTLATAYRNFALAEPAAYRILFEIDPMPGDESPASKQSDRTLKEGAGAYAALQTRVQSAVDAGVIRGDADTLAHLYWAGMHGIVSLHLSGQLILGRELDALIASMLETLLGGSRPESIGARP